jgi:8-oxo-dGTP diphosphatase
LHRADDGWTMVGMESRQKNREKNRETDQDFDQQLSQRLEGWQPDHIGTLVFIRQNDQVLLIRKKRGHGAGKFNGPGGKLEEHETPREGAIRETLEEVRVRVRDPLLLGRFKFVDLSAPQWYGYVFLAREFEGELEETDEAEPHWFSVEELPFSEMWEDDRIWLPRLLEGESLQGEFLFDDGRLLTHRLKN